MEFSKKHAGQVLPEEGQAQVQALEFTRIVLSSRIPGQSPRRELGTGWRQFLPQALGSGFASRPLPGEPELRSGQQGPGTRTWPWSEAALLPLC